MQTLDQMLASKAANVYRDTISELLSEGSFSRETRDEIMQKIRTLGSDMSDASVSFVKEILEEEINGKSFLYWKIYQQFLTAELEMLRNFRDEVDLTKEESMNDIPVDYAWLGNKIKELYTLLGELEITLEDSELKLGNAQAEEAVEEI